MNTGLFSGVTRRWLTLVVGHLAALLGASSLSATARGDSIPSFSEWFENVVSWRGAGFEITAPSPSSSTSGRSSSSPWKGTNTSTSGWVFTPTRSSGSATLPSGSSGLGTGWSSGSAMDSPDAVINLGTGPYPFSESLTTGQARPWFESPVAQRLFGGVPGSSQIRAFSELVLDRVQNAYERSGVSGLKLTLDPNAGAPRALSVVSNTRYGPIPQAAGVALSGYSGFSFIDAFSDARSLDELGWLVAHNVAHELMHTFGVDHHDTTGNFLDSGVTNWSTMLDPEATFSASAVADLNSRDFSQIGHATRSSLADGQQIDASFGLSTSCRHCQMLAMAQQLGDTSGGAVAPVPEPASLIGWGTLLGLSAWVVRKRVGRVSV